MNFRTAMKELLHGEEPALDRKKNAEQAQDKEKEKEENAVKNDVNPSKDKMEKSKFILPEKDSNMKDCLPIFYRQDFSPKMW